MCVCVCVLQVVLTFDCFVHMFWLSVTKFAFVFHLLRTIGFACVCVCVSVMTDRALFASEEELLILYKKDLSAPTVSDADADQKSDAGSNKKNAEDKSKSTVTLSLILTVKFVDGVRYIPGD